MVIRSQQWPLSHLQILYINKSEN